MPIEISMPRLSDTMETGTIIKWSVKEGDAVEPGDVIADVETDKATMELQAFDEGTVASILLEEGKSVPVGSTVLVLAEEGEDIEEVKAAAGKSARKGAQDEERDEKQDQDLGEKRQRSGSRQSADAAATAVAEPPAQANGAATADTTADKADDKADGEAPSGGRIFASPLARKIAEEKGLDLGSIEGTGPGGRIVKRDVEQATGAPAAQASTADRAPAGGAPAPAAPPAALEAKVAPLSNMRRTIARRLVDSKQSIPHYQVTVAAEMDALLELRATLNDQLQSQQVKLSVNDFLVRACAVAMHEHPYVNSKWLDKGPEGEAAIEILGEVNVGVAIALPEERGGGLVVGVLRNADRMGLRMISSETRRLAEKARSKGLSVEEMEGATFTLSNLGMFGVEHFTAIINPPNVAILAVGAAIEQPVVRDGAIASASRMQMTMSSDHRVVDGAMAAQYLGTVKRLLENPAALLV